MTMCEMFQSADGLRLQDLITMLSYLAPRESRKSHVLRKLAQDEFKTHKVHYSSSVQLSKLVGGSLHIKCTKWCRELRAEAESIVTARLKPFPSAPHLGSPTWSQFENALRLPLIAAACREAPEHLEQGPLGRLVSLCVENPPPSTDRESGRASYLSRGALRAFFEACGGHCTAYTSSRLARGRALACLVAVCPGEENQKLKAELRALALDFNRI